MSPLTCCPRAERMVCDRNDSMKLLISAGVPICTVLFTIQVRSPRVGEIALTSLILVVSLRKASSPPSYSPIP